ncbi:hypothetical protein BKA93DRAFT_769218 [Sparassis latifolia]
MATAAISPGTATSAASTSASSSAPEIYSRRPLSADSITVSPSLDSVLVLSPRSAPPDALTSMANTGDVTSNSNGPDPDPQIIEALRSKDRIYVLKLGEMMEGLITERRLRIDLNPTTSYQRMLVYRCSTYYKLSPETDGSSKNIFVYYRAESKIPARRISELVPPEESAQPAFKIMRRGIHDGARGRHTSQTGSIGGEDADLSDVEPSETGSVGGRSNATAGSKKFMTLEEREAAYNEARSRIFMGFEEKEKDMSANSSTFSLNSGSASTSGGCGGSISDLDDSASSVPTESEWSGPVTREQWDGRRSGGSSSRSRTSYNNGSGSSRNSRATSPSFTYASLYEPPVDLSQYVPQPPPGYIAHYIYPYSNGPGQPAGAPYLAPYSYYMPYGYPHPAAIPPHPDSAATAVTDGLYPPPQQMPPHGSYVNPYMWAHSSPGQPPQHPPHMQQSTTNMPSAAPVSSVSPHPSPSHPQNFPTYAPHYNPYPMHGYPSSSSFQQGMASSSMTPSPHIQGQPLYMPEYASPLPMGHSTGNGMENAGNHSRASSRSSGHGSKRGVPRRTPWSYGPGAGSGGYTYNLTGLGGGIGGTEVVGPRLSSRRISSSSGSTGTRTPGDEASSTASSSTNSSSSRQTFTSTSSKHPLPARPDWAVGLKPQPILHQPRHHDHITPNSRTMSPRIGGQAHLGPPHQAQPVLHSNDFPPLSSAPERRTPVIGGAWTNTSSMRSILSPGPQGTMNPQGTALVHYPNMNTNVNANMTANQSPPGLGANGLAQVEEQESGFERPPPRGSAELFNPKGGNRSVHERTSKADARELVRVGSKPRAEGILADRLDAMTLDGLPQALNKDGGAPAVAEVGTVNVGCS